MASSTKARPSRLVNPSTIERRRRALKNEIDSYASAVVSGKIQAGKYHRLSCARHLRDIAREGTKKFPYVLNIEKARRFFRFAEKLKHYKGKWAGQYIRLTPYQKFRLGSIFGWVHKETGLRRFRTAYNEIPRKNGKSLEAAVVMLYLVFFDGENGAEGYCIATKREQAMLVFKDAAALVRSSGLKSRIKLLTRNMNRLERNQKLEALGADYDSTDGLNPSAVCVDEFHAQKNRGLIDVMITAWGAREQPFCFMITTAGDDPVSPCGDEHEYACNVLDEMFEDETYFAFVAHADVAAEGVEGDDPFSIKTFAKANPHYGISIFPDGVLADLKKAKNQPAAAASYKQKRLNIWVSATAPWLSLEGWKNGQSDFAIRAGDDYLAGKPRKPPAHLAGRECYVAADLASKIDLCPLVFLFPPIDDDPKWSILRWVWSPADTLEDRAHRDRAPYVLWKDRGYLNESPGTNINQRVVQKTIVEQRENFKILGIGFDPWHAGTLINDLITDDGFDEEQVLEVPQTYAGISNAALKLEAEVLAGNVDAGGCPLVAWTVSNAVVQKDGKDNIQPIKKRSRGRIDPVVAITIAMSLALKMSTDTSIYETREPVAVGGR